MLCVHAMKILKMKNKTRTTTCCVVCVRYEDIEDEEQDQNDSLLCCVCTLYRSWRWRTVSEWQLTMLCVYAMQILKNKTRMTTYYAVCVRYADLEKQDQNDNLLCYVCTLCRSWRTGPEWQLTMLCVYALQALKMNNETRRQFTTGSIVNFMAIDCQKLQTVSTQLWVLLSAPVQVTSTSPAEVYGLGIT